jgi:hypothetical protein
MPSPPIAASTGFTVVPGLIWSQGHGLPNDLKALYSIVYDCASEYPIILRGKQCLHVRLQTQSCLPTRASSVVAVLAPVSLFGTKSQTRHEFGNCIMHMLPQLTNLNRCIRGQRGPSY